MWADRIVYAVVMPAENIFLFHYKKPAILGCTTLSCLSFNTWCNDELAVRADKFNIFSKCHIVGPVYMTTTVGHGARDYSSGAHNHNHKEELNTESVVPPPLSFHFSHWK